MSESDSEGDEYVYVGTALVKEQVLPLYAAPNASRVSSQLVSLPVHQQQVRDEQGRQRLHGAFTGGFSAGYFNTVDSKEGFTPVTFRSSRDNRAQRATQHYSSFLDEDEREELSKRGLQASVEYDTFAGAAGTALKTAAAQDAQARHGHDALQLFPEEVLRPVSSSIGVQLLTKMGWRQGGGVGYREAENLAHMGYDVPDSGNLPAPRQFKWSPLPSTQAANMPLRVLHPKNNCHGVGYDPYQNARSVRQLRESARGQACGAALGPRRRGVAFAASVLEEDDTYGGALADYVDDAAADRHAFAREVVLSDDEDEDQLANLHGGAPRLSYAPEQGLLRARQGTMGEESFIEGFVRADIEQPRAPDVQQEHKALKKGAQPHRFAAPCSLWYGALRSDGLLGSEGQIPGTDVPTPTDVALRQRIEQMAALVVRSGRDMYDFVRDAYAGKAEYTFLHGGEGSAYYELRIRTLQGALAKAGVSMTPMRLSGDAARGPMPVELRAAMLGEVPLSGTSHPAPHSRRAAEVSNDTAAGERHCGDAAEARKVLLERAAAAGIVRPGATLSSRFVRAGESPITLTSDQGQPGNVEPVRTQEEWRPEPSLCRLFNVPDPYRGRQPGKDEGAPGVKYASIAPGLRGAAYAQSLPERLRPGSLGGNDLPPPPPRRGALASDRAQSGTVPGAPVSPLQGNEAPSLDDEAAAAAAEALYASLLEDEVAPEGEPPSAVTKPVDLFTLIFEDTDNEGDVSDGSQIAQADMWDQRIVQDNEQAIDDVPSQTGTTGTRQPPRADLAAAMASAERALGERTAARAMQQGLGRPHSPTLGSRRMHLSPGVSNVNHSDMETQNSEGEGPSKIVGERGRRKKDKKSKKRRRHGEGKEDKKDMVRRALEVVRQDAKRQSVSTEEILQLAAALKKHKHRSTSKKHHKRREDKDP